MSQPQVQRFLAGADALSRLTSGLSTSDLLAHPVPGTWSLQTLIIHIMDSDLIATHRMKRIIAENNPLLISYDETAFAASLHYEDLDAALAADLFRINRIHTGQILTRLPDAAFARTGIHNERGKVSLLDLVRMYADHVEHHMKFARAKLAALGRPIQV